MIANPIGLPDRCPGTHRLGCTKQNELHTLLPWNWTASTSVTITSHALSDWINVGANRQLKTSPVIAVSLTICRTTA
jgi:hypothetical protein